MAKVICIANQKGGVGKTTTTINLAHGLARHGKETLVVDFDPQGQAATFLGVNTSADVFFLLMASIAGAPQAGTSELMTLKQRVRSTGRSKLWIIPGGSETAAAQTTLAAMNKPVSYVAEALKPFSRNGLDYIILDTSPSLGGLQERALWASDLVISPVMPDFAATDGLIQLVNTLKTLGREKAWAGKLLGILPTFFDETTRETKATMSNLLSAFGGLMLPPVHRATAFRECAAEGVTIFEKDPDGRAAQEYEQIVSYILRA